jgi:hypothetical protein
MASLLLACGGNDKDSSDASTEDTVTGDSVDIEEEEFTFPDTCETDEDCSDSDPCSGTERCDTESGTCEWGDALADGVVCSPDPRRICLGSRCRDSVCGDGYVDTGGGEFCEPSLDAECMDACTYICDEMSDCVDDDLCNGGETCNMETHFCEPGTPSANGVVCGSPPRQICLYGTCVESVCGDGYIDVVGGEECERPDSRECTVDCGVDGEQECNWLCNWSECAGPPPANDNCEDAVDASGGGTFEGTTCEAVNSWEIVPSCMEDRAPDVFYTLSLSAETEVTIHTCDSTDFDTVLAVFSGTCDGELTEVSCIDDASGCGDGTGSSLTRTLAAGDYVIIVDGKELAADEYSEGSFTLTVSLP